MMDYKMLRYAAAAIAKTLGVDERRVCKIVAEELERLRTEVGVSDPLKT